MGNKLATLSGDGLLSSETAIISKLYLYFITSLESQTFFHYTTTGISEVKSFKSISYIFDELDDIEFKTRLHDMLVELYGSRYDNISPIIDIVHESNTVATVKISITMYKNKERVGELVKMIDVSNNSVRFNDDNIDDLGKGK